MVLYPSGTCKLEHKKHEYSANYMSDDYILSRDMWDMIDDRIRALNDANHRLDREREGVKKRETRGLESTRALMKLAESLRRPLLDHMFDERAMEADARAWEECDINMDLEHFIYANKFKRGLDFIRSQPAKVRKSATAILKESFPMLQFFYLGRLMSMNSKAWVREQRDIARVSQCVERLSTHMLASTSSHKLCECCMKHFEREIDEIREAGEKALDYKSVAYLNESTPHDTSRIVREPIKHYS